METWPFWLEAHAGGVRTLQPIHKDKYYIFPEVSTTLPTYTPMRGFLKVTDALAAYARHEGEPMPVQALDPENLGCCDVVMSGEQYIEMLKRRQIELSDFGHWSAA